MKRRKPWLLFAAVLLVVASAYLMARGDPSSSPSRRAVTFPRALRPAEVQRIQHRQRQPVPVPTPGLPPPVVARPRDPVLAALPRAGPLSCNAWKVSVLTLSCCS